RGKRGLFITLIHKFRPEELKKLQGKLKKIPQTRETILTRRNVITFIDEGHRTQYGNLAGQKKSILGNAFSFAFTGTPISKRGRNTYFEFSYLPEEPYLDKYLITDSIRDGSTLKIVYQPKLEKEVHLKKDQLETFLKLGFEELPEEIRGRVEEEVKQKLNLIKLRLEAPSRIKVIAEDIAHHFKKNIDGKFKAMVVAGSRRACELYKQELDQHLPREYSEVVMTYQIDDEPLLLQAVAEKRERYGGRQIGDIRKTIIEKFKEEDLPKILIVTEMLLTGFDAPVLQVMYLDKLLKEHRLLQAIARTNRPFKDLKEAGLVIDYVGILKEFKRAFELYREEDIKGAVYDFDQIRGEFVQLLEELLGLFKEVPKNYSRETLLKSIEVLTGEEKKGEAFLEQYKSLRKTFELLGPDEIKIGAYCNMPLLEDYKWLSAIYAYYMKMVVQKPAYEDQVQRFYDKTLKFVHQTLKIEKLEQNLLPIEVDEKYLQALEEKLKNKKEKAANILFTLNRLVLVDRGQNPVYESLVEKVERLLEMWRGKNKDYERIYREGVKAVKEINQHVTRQRSLNFSDLEYSILIVLESKFNQQEDFAGEVKALSHRLKKHMFFDWSHQTTVKKEVEREIRKFARGIKGRYNLSLEEMNTLHDKLFENVKAYGTA
ncbi:MAG TPA: HsdR family type I site-specific deoxyribonuclease, partial [Thermodesulfobacteriota bacterium]|nr:HsdR family type I site-specific deoxyribonuclease [Thermodesulfobacteriota bacterium]